MKITPINIVEYNLFKKELFKKTELNSNQCPDCKKVAPIKELAQDKVQFSK